MSGKIIPFVQIAEPNIETLFRSFLHEEEQRLKQARTLLRYQQIIELLRRYLNGYAYTTLTKPEAVLFRRYTSEKREDSRTFCEIFGPDQILENLPTFLRYFIIEKVLAPEQFKRAAGTLTKNLTAWLKKEGHITRQQAAWGKELGAKAVRNIPKAERATDIVFHSIQETLMPSDFTMRDYLGFHHFVITDVNTGIIWVRAYDDPDQSILPIAIPQEASELLEPQWEIICSVARVGQDWRIIEIGNIYPG